MAEFIPLTFQNCRFNQADSEVLLNMAMSRDEMVEFLVLRWAEVEVAAAAKDWLNLGGLLASVGKAEEVYAYRFCNYDWKTSKWMEKANHE